MAERRWQVLHNKQYRQLFVIQPELPEPEIAAITFRLRSARSAAQLRDLLNLSEQRAQIVELARNLRDTMIMESPNSSVFLEARTALYTALDKLD